MQDKDAQVKLAWLDQEAKRVLPYELYIEVYRGILLSPRKEVVSWTARPSWPE